MESQPMNNIGSGADSATEPALTGMDHREESKASAASSGPAIHSIFSLKGKQQGAKDRFN